MPPAYISQNTSSQLYRPSFSFQSTGQPRPWSSTWMDRSWNRVTVITRPKPARASSMALERISNTACSQPSSPSEPKMTPGRFRTRSAPFRLEMLSLSYAFFLGISFLRRPKPPILQYTNPILTQKFPSGKSRTGMGKKCFSGVKSCRRRGRHNKPATGGIACAARVLHIFHRVFHSIMSTRKTAKNAGRPQERAESTAGPRKMQTGGTCLTASSGRSRRAAAPAGGSSWPAPDR